MRNVNRAAAGAAAWQVIQNTDGKVSVWQRVRAVPRMIGAKLRGRYPELGGGKLFTMLALVVYVVSPIDFIPELLFSVLGLVDDVAVAVWLTTMALGESERFVVWEREQEAQEAFYRANPDGPGQAGSASGWSGAESEHAGTQAPPQGGPRVEDHVDSGRKQRR